MRITKCLTSGVVAAVAVGLLAAFLAGCVQTGKEITTSAAKVESKYVNEYCPIMGRPIDPATVTPELARRYEDKLVAFYCSRCPEQWDKLTDEEKDAKLLTASVDQKHAKRVHRRRWRGYGKFRRHIRY